MMSNETANDIMITAIEQGISYWMNEECTDVSVKNNTVSFMFEGKKYSVSPEKIKRVYNSFHHKYPKIMILEDHDCISADAIFQFAAFGEILFG